MDMTWVVPVRSRSARHARLRFSRPCPGRPEEVAAMCLPDGDRAEWVVRVARSGASPLPPLDVTVRERTLMPPQVGADPLSERQMVRETAASLECLDLRAFPRSTRHRSTSRRRADACGGHHAHRQPHAVSWK